MSKVHIAVLGHDIPAGERERAALVQLRQLAAETTGQAKALTGATGRVAEQLDTFRAAAQDLVWLTSVALDASEALQASTHLLLATATHALGGTDVAAEAAFTAEFAPTAHQYADRATEMHAALIRGVYSAMLAETHRVLLLISERAAQG